MIRPIKNKEREAIIQSLRSGVVPKIGLQHIQVGRSEEIKSFVRDIQNVSEGGSSFRFVIGEYGSGKTFFLSLVRSIALEKGLVTMHADLSPSKRLYGSQGQARYLLSELISSLATRTRQDGNALENILDRFVSIVKEEVNLNRKGISQVVSSMLKDMAEIPGGFNFIQVVSVYCKAYEAEDEILKNKALKWLRAEYTTRIDSFSVLNEDAAIVDEAYSTPGLSDVEKRRILKYKCIVRNAIATQRFIAARDQVPRKEFFSIACDLIELRTQLKRDLPDTWGRVFRSFPLEVKWWRYVAPELKKKYPEMELED